MKKIDDVYTWENMDEYKKYAEYKHIINECKKIIKCNRNQSLCDKIIEMKKEITKNKELVKKIKKEIEEIKTRRVK